MAVNVGANPRFARALTMLGCRYTRDKPERALSRCSHGRTRRAIAKMIANNQNRRRSVRKSNALKRNLNIVFTPFRAIRRDIAA
jgi:hypothetical protein